VTGRAAAAGAAVLAVLAGCGEDGQTSAEEAEAGIAAAVGDRLRGAGDGSVAVVASCPEDLDIEEARTFRCEVTVEGGEPLAVDLAVDATGTVDLRQAVIPTDAAEDYLAGELATPAEGPVTVDCGDAPLLVADVGDEVTCDVVRDADGAARTVVVTVLTTDGTVRYEVRGATTTTAPAGG